MERVTDSFLFKCKYKHISCNIDQLKFYLHFVVKMSMRIKRRDKIEVAKNFQKKARKPFKKSKKKTKRLREKVNLLIKISKICGCLRLKKTCNYLFIIKIKLKINLKDFLT